MLCYETFFANSCRPQAGTQIDEKSCGRKQGGPIRECHILKFCQVPTVTYIRSCATEARNEAAMTNVDRYLH